MTGRCFNPKNGNRKLFQQALHLFLQCAMGSGLSCRDVAMLGEFCCEKFDFVLRYPIQQDMVNGLVGTLRRRDT